MTCSLPSRLLGMVTHLVGLPGLERAVSRDSIAPFVFFSFFTNASTACNRNGMRNRRAESSVLKHHLFCPLFFFVALLPAKQALDSGGGEGEEGVDAAGHPRHGSAWHSPLSVCLTRSSSPAWSCIPPLCLYLALLSTAVTCGIAPLPFCEECYLK